jgi:tetratricopeptide (TPR) repeat protein
MATKKKTTSEVVTETPETQLQSFDRAVKLFHARQFNEARDLFSKATDGPLREVAHNARLHINMCNRRIEKPDLELRTIDDYYNLGVERLNARDLESARRNLLKAVELTRSDGDSADHVYYAMAACQAVSGDWRGAYENLKRAIEIEPRNRVAARQDPDFSGSGQQQLMRGLLHPDKSSPF